MPNVAPAGISLTRSHQWNFAPREADFAFGDADGYGSGGAGAARIIFGHPEALAAPAGTDRTLTIPRSYTLHKADFGFGDADGNGFKSVIVTTLPGAGTLYYDSNGSLGGGRTAVLAGQAINAADILAGKLTYVAPSGVSGTNYAHLTFQVRDDSGAGGGLDTDPSPNTLTFNLVASGATPTTFGTLIDLTSLFATTGFTIQGDAAGDAAGRSMSSAGDVNGDGFADIIVGAPGNDSGAADAGAAYVIFGKASGFGTLIDLTGLSATTGFTIQGEAADDRAGINVSSAGDVNGDGFADLLVGARYNDSGGANAGAAYVIFGKASGFGTVINLATIAAADGFKIQGDAAGDDTGWSVSSAGDVNGDGLADILVGANRNDGGGIDAGAAYVIFGKTSGFGTLIDLTGLASTTGFKIQGDVAGDLAGFSVSSAGDVNGDGFSDIIIGARAQDSGGSGAGAAYVIFGKSAGFGSLIDLTGLSATEGFKIQGDVSGDYAGWSVSSAGDVNGDGFADIIVGANGNDGGGSGAGAAYVIFGKASGFGALIDLTDLTPAAGFKIQGDASYDNAGVSVSSAGDVNGDGYADILVGARNNDSGGTDAGAAYLIFGRLGGFGPLIDLAALSATAGFKIQGDAAGDIAGYDVSSVGDVNGDGFGDLAIGALYNDGGGTNAGAAYVIFGHANTFTAPAGADRTLTIPRSYILHKADFGFSDADGNAFKAVILSTLPTGGTLYYDSNGSLGGGRTAVVAGQAISAADINAGKLTYVAPAGVSGTNYDHLTFQVRDDGGSAGGSVDTDLSPNTLTFNLVGSAATPTSFGGLIDLTGLSASAGFKVQGDVSFDSAGWSVSSAGDVNGDGFADIIIGATGGDNGSYFYAGAAYVIFGRATGVPTVIDLTGLTAANGFKIQGIATGDYAGISVSSAGDVNGDGFTDIIVGAIGNDGGGANAGAAYVIFGKATGFGSLITLGGLTGGNGFRIQGDVAGDLAGFSVSTAGDINGDGFADIIVGAYGNDSGGSNAGAAYVIFGKASGFGPLIDLTSLTAANGFKIQGDLAGDYAGFRVSSAGDVNGDGFADIIVGAPDNDDGGDKAGAAYVIFGRASGFGSLIDLTSLPAGSGFKIQGDLSLDYAGISVSSAGDVNGDGFADILVGAFGNDGGGNGNTGAAYVIFGKSGGFGSLIDLTGLAAATGFKIQGDRDLDDAGFSVSSAGDVNGDGYADILIGALGNDNGDDAAGAAYVIFGKAAGFGMLIDLTNLHAIDGFKIQGDLAGDRAGRSVSAAGDVNGDGYDDIIVGAYGNDSGGTNAGAAYVIFGHANSFSAPAGIDRTLTIPRSHVLQKGDFGFSDADGNGLGSVIVTSLPGAGRLYYDPNGALGGGLSPVVAGQVISAADILAGKLFYVAAPGSAGGTNDHFAFQVRDDSGAGGTLDTDQSANTLNFVLAGNAQVPATFGNLIDLTGLSTANGFKIQGDVAGDYAGFSVSSAGDVNGDGFADLIIGAYGNDSGGTSAGAAYVIFGKASGFGSLIDLTGLAATDGFKIQGDLTSDFAGVSVSSAGDFNCDGFADLLVSAVGNDDGGTLAGAAYVIFGKASGFGGGFDLSSLTAANGFEILGDIAGDLAGQSVSSAGDINGDGFADIIIGANGNDSGGTKAGAAYVIFGKPGTSGPFVDLTNLAAGVGFKIQGDAAGDNAGFRVSSAGDVNGDGFADMLVGAYGNAGGGSYAGAAYVIFGRASGFGNFIDLSGLAATDGFKIQGNPFGERAGISVSSAGDVNGDGFADILVGASFNSTAGNLAGAAYVVFGKASGFGSLLDLTNLAPAAGFKIQGEAASDLAGVSVSSAGDVNGDGYADLLVGARGNDSGGAQAGAAYVIFGKAGGFATLIDLAHLAQADGFKIQGDAAGDNAGIGVSAAGDVNGDGFADILVGADMNDSGGAEAGAAYVIFGHATVISTAVGDTGSVAENAAGTINVLANDVDIATGRAVARIGGQTITVGSPVTLASGAIVSLNNDGTLSYDPNHAFDATPAAGSGASNTPAHDSFTYTLFGGATATVSVTISGVDSNDVLTGTAGADTMSGGIGIDTLEGLGGNDMLIGNGGADTLIGGDGDDIYYAVDDPGDVIIEAAGQGNDAVYASVSYTLTAGAEVEFVGTTLDAGTAAINFIGNEFAQTIVGNAGANTLSGGGGNDALYGLGGGDILIGGTGADAMTGGTGNDIYIVDDAGDTIAEANGEGVDQAYTSVNYALGAGVSIEVLSVDDYAATSAINLTGNEFGQQLIGNAGANVLSGGGGADALYGLGGDDIMIGGTGADAMTGGTGNDIYIVDDAGDTIAEANGEGVDQAYTSVSYALGAGVSIEGLSVDDYAATSALNLTGNEFGQQLIGNAGANTLSGGGGNDALYGLGGNDILIGGTGADAMTGGTGNDIYIVDNTGDTIAEANGEGVDQAYTSVSYALGAGASIEGLSVDDYAATSAINLTGNEFGQQLIGNAGANTLSGGGGNDALYGLGGNDIMIGGTGADSMTGGTGNDIYIVDDAGDTIAEANGEGVDQAYTSVSYALGAGVSIEGLSVDDYAATSALNLTGNEFGQQLIGNAGANTLSGGGGNDALYGLGGNDILIGGTGADAMTGGTGNDIYIVDNTGDTIAEANGEGVDQAYTSVNYALGAGVSIEVLSVDDYAATSAINLTGNEFGQQLIGNAGANVLNGGGGNDTLYGLGGSDVFAFTTAPGAGNVDTIADFAHSSDKIALDDAVFTAIGSLGALNPNAFVVGAAAGDADDRIIYDQATGNLYYDADGNGAGAAIQFANLQPNLAITASDFQVI